MSWEKAHDWYGRLVGVKGHEYHRTLLWPNLKELLPKQGSLLDFACGNGVLLEILGPKIEYLGIDCAPSLIAEAKKRNRGEFEIHDLQKPLDLGRQFDWVTCLLAYQNIQDSSALFENAKRHLKKGGHFLLVMNHPCFRIPRQSHWIDDMEKKMRARRIDRYMSPLDIPIQVNPGKGKSETLIHHHTPLSTLFKVANNHSFAATRFDEWCSPKESEGKRQKMENRARAEIPLFLCIIFTQID